MKRTTDTSPIHDGYNGLYLERSGVGMAQMAEALTLPPERPLSDEEKWTVRQFESDILELRVGIGVTLGDVLQAPLSEGKLAPLFFAESIMNGEVSIDGVDIPEFNSSDSLYRWLGSSHLDSKQLKELSKNSTEAYKSKVVNALTREYPIDERDTESRPILLDPENFILKMENLSSARELLLDWKRSAPRGSKLQDAKVAYVDIFLAKINAKIATGIPMIDILRSQAVLGGNENLITKANSLISPQLAQAMYSDESRRRLFRRLDFLRNGMGSAATGEATAISEDLRFGSAEEAQGGIFTVEQMRQLQGFMLEPEEMKSIFKKILSKVGLLSSEDESTWTSDRKGRAADDLFQVIINPDGSTFAVEALPGVYMVASEPRSLYDVMMVGGYHELEHINQALADGVVGQSVKAAKIQGKRVSGLREAGANVRQREAEERLFGYRKPYADTYSSALRVFEDGGSLGDAVKAFYEAKLRLVPYTDKLRAAKEAADRVVRLTRGGINSQPMVYAEESIIAQELSTAPREVQRRAMAVTGLDLVDQLRLHKFGLLDIGSDVQSTDWSDIIMTVLDPYVRKATDES